MRGAGNADELRTALGAAWSRLEDQNYVWWDIQLDQTLLTVAFSAAVAFISGVLGFLLGRLLRLERPLLVGGSPEAALLDDHV